jgi:hypothetical protein
MITIIYVLSMIFFKLDKDLPRIGDYLGGGLIMLQHSYLPTYLLVIYISMYPWATYLATYLSTYLCKIGMMKS